MMIRLRGALLAGAIALGVGCSEGDLPCAENLDLSCAPLYTPTYDEIFNRTLHPTCAQSGSSCHAAEGKQGGLVFEDADAAYARLLGKTDGRARVTPGDPACSVIVERLESKDTAVVMPPGSPLSDAERCVILQWIKSGAKR